MLWSAVVAVALPVMLLWGFSRLPWALPAAACTVACCAGVFVRGAWIRSVSSTEIAVSEEGIAVRRRGVKTVLRFQDLTGVSFTGRIQPAAVLHGSDRSIRVYKTLYGYPVFWKAVRSRIPKGSPMQFDLTVRCNGVSRPLPLLAGASVGVLMLAYGIDGLARSMALGPALAVLGLGLAVLAAPAAVVCFSIRSLRCGESIEFRTPLSVWQCPAGELGKVLFGQETKRKLNGPDKTPAYRRLPPLRGYGLALTLRRKDGSELVVSELMTGYPLELLYEYLQNRYTIAAGDTEDNHSAPNTN